MRRRRGLGGIVALGLLVAAVARELRLPVGERTWHGRVGGVVPYDLRRPTFARFRQALWDPDRPLVVGSPFGVGWTVNLGGLLGARRW